MKPSAFFGKVTECWSEAAEVGKDVRLDGNMSAIIRQETGLPSSVHHVK